jgi:membrane fusion protein, multidrug efflux system
MKTRRTHLVWAVVGTAVLVSVSSCGKKEAPPREPRPVRTIMVAGGADGESATFTGEIRSRFETDLGFQVGGKLVDRAVDVGAVVKKGAVLARMDPTDQSLGVDAARSAVAAARADYERQRADEARFRDLLERGLTTRANFLAQQTATKTAQSRLEQAQADLRLSEQKLGYTTLRADEDGVVTRVMVEEGAVLSPGQKVMSIARPSELEVVFDVPDNRIDEIRTAADVQFALLSSPAALYPARVREVSPSADPVTRTYQVKTSIPNPPWNLRLGMNVAVTIPNRTNATSIALPSTALFQKDNGAAVWVVKKDLTLELRPVQVERYDSNRVVIKSGVQPGDQVVTAGVQKLSAGEKIRLLSERAP